MKLKQFVDEYEEKLQNCGLQSVLLNSKTFENTIQTMSDEITLVCLIK